MSQASATNASHTKDFRKFCNPDLTCLARRAMLIGAGNLMRFDHDLPSFRRDLMHHIAFVSKRDMRLTLEFPIFFRNCVDRDFQ